MLYSCPNHELSREIIIQIFYARPSRNDQTMLDTSCAGSFMKKTVEFRWDLLERIKRNSEDLEFDEGKELVINLEFDCVKSFMETDAFHKFSTPSVPKFLSQICLNMDVSSRVLVLDTSVSRQI